MADSYVLLGADVANSPTPAMFNSAFRELGIESSYSSRNVSREGFASAFRELAEGRVRGFNVTMPYKESVTGLLDSMDETSRKVGAVNTVSREGSAYRGYNTDVDGIVEPLESAGAVPIKRAVVIGTGGAAKALCGAMDSLGCDELTVVSRELERAKAFAERMRSAFPGVAFTPAQVGNRLPRVSDLLFNASPSGSSRVPMPKGVLELLDARPVVFDAVYYPVETELIREAGRLGCTTIHGHEMLLHQALHSFRIWTGRDPPAGAMRSALLEKLEAVSA